jgi:hypothetical protein
MVAERFKVLEALFPDRIDLGLGRAPGTDPVTSSTRLAQIIAATQADEIMVTTMLYAHAARRHSYELLAEAFGLAQA